MITESVCFFYNTFLQEALFVGNISMYTKLMDSGLCCYFGYGRRGLVG